MRERILLWDKEHQDKSLTLPGGEPKYAWKSVCLSPDGNHLVANEIRTLGSKSAYRWDGKKWQSIPRPQNHEVVIHSVNDSGLMVGTSDVGDPRNGREAVVIRNGRTQVLPSPAHKAIALAVSNSGFIAGQALDKFGLAQACLWKDDQPTLLGTMSGKSSIAHAVNDSGMVVGLLRTTGDREAAFVWHNGQMRPLLDPSSTSSIAYDINNSGVIVGLVYSPKTYGFIASGDLVLNLNDLLLESPGWTVTKAVAVNDQNCVLAVAEYESEEHLVLLTPST
jgi:probable HAF family extracellular repeat protein